MPKQVLTPKSLYQLQNVTDIQNSPDGKYIAYLVETTNQETDKVENSIWLQRLTGDAATEPIRLTSHPTDGPPRWSPDSKRIAFVSSRTDKAQLHIINIDGGEARLVKTEQKPISTPLWSPDGLQIAFKALDEPPAGERYPGEPAELQKQAACADAEKKQDEAPAVNVITDINYQADGRGLIFDKFPQLYVVTLENGKCERVTQGRQRIEDFIWHNKGSALLYLVDVYCPTFAKHTTNINQVDVATGNISRIANFAGTLRRIDLAPGGRWLLLTGADNSRPTGVGVARLWLIDLHSPSLPLGHDAIQCLTSDLDASCALAHWAADAASVYFVKQWHGASVFARLNLSAGQGKKIETEHLTDLGTISQFDLLPDNNCVFVAHDFVTPPELYLQDGQHTQQLTQLNTAFVDEHELCPAEKFTYQVADGLNIDGWLMRPLGYEAGRRYPTILSVHGGPTGAYSNSWQFPFQLLAHQGFAVVFTNPRGSVTYGEDFTAGVVGDIGGQDFQDILAGLDQAIDMGVVDAGRVGITGWSYGGYMTCWAVTQSDRFQAAVAGASISNWVDLYGCGDSHVYDEGLFGGPPFIKEEEHMERSPLRFVQNVNTPLLMLHGELDIRCPTGQSDQFFTALKRAGKDVVYVRYPGQYHGFKRPSYIVDRWTRTIGWFEHYLLGDQ